LLRAAHLQQQTKKRLEKRFKDPADPLRLVIVRDMWLTGFDAPCVHTLYVDKPMKGHNLMQAIARVNRVFKDKQGGLVVDYIGIANELKSALKEYTAAQGPRHRPWTRTRPTACWQRSSMCCAACCMASTTATSSPAATRLLAGAANHVLGIKDGKKRFADIGCGHEQSLYAVLHPRRGQSGARGGGLLPGVKVIADQARPSTARRRRRGA
jgi:type I restriction enzyme R subunit